MKYFKYIIIVIFLIVISKWVITFLPSSYQENGVLIKEKKETAKEIELDISFKNLEKPINNEYGLAQKDITKFIEEEIEKFNNTAKTNLSKKDGFLDWLFGWGTGYKMIWKKLKGYTGSEDNEIKFVEEKFKTDVLNYEDVIQKINNYSKNRINDFYKTILTIMLKDISEKVNQIKEQKSDYNSQEIYKQDLPWGKYITQLGTNGFEASTVVATDLTVATVIGGKVASVLGPKVLGIVSAKAATIIAGKVAAGVGLVFAPIIDYGLNEGAKMLQYEDTKEQFEESIDAITKELTLEIKEEYDNQLIEIKNEINKELNKTISIRESK